MGGSSSDRSGSLDPKAYNTTQDFDMCQLCLLDYFKSKQNRRHVGHIQSVRMIWSQEGEHHIIVCHICGSEWTALCRASNIAEMS
jgi:hypothetical protein